MFSFFLISLLLTSSFSVMQLTLLTPGYNGGKCLDGTPAGFYFEAGLNNDWLIFLQGGGYCDTLESCTKRAQSAHGSSNYWNPTMTGSGGLSTSKTENPYFYEANHVFVPYCNGDVHMGQRTTPSVETWGYYFSGHLNLDMILDTLLNNSTFNLKNGKMLLLSGSSAGGLGTFGNLDFVSDKLAHMVVRGAPIAGWFFGGNATDEPNDPWAPPDDYPHWINGTEDGIGHDDNNTVLWDAYLNPKCTKAESVYWHCQSVHVLYNYITSPVFVMENQFDKQQLNSEMQLPSQKTANTTAFVEYFGASMLISVDQVFNNTLSKDIPDGLFFASCYDHGGGLDIGYSGATTKINGYCTADLVGDWFYQLNQNPHRLADSCMLTSSLPCNPTCDSY